MKKIISKLLSKGLVLANCLALVLVINNVNVACSWMWGQPETSDEIKEKYRKF